jgi:hypothetical protein
LAASFMSSPGVVAGPACGLSWCAQSLAGAMPSSGGAAAGATGRGPGDRRDVGAKRICLRSNLRIAFVNVGQLVVESSQVNGKV